MNRSANSLICLCAALVGFGLVMIYSVSSGRFGDNPDQCQGAVVKHMVCIGLGVVAFLVTMTMDYRLLKNRSVCLGFLGVTALLLLGVLFFGTVRNGARRWYSIYGPLTFQPSEMAKIAIPLFVAWFVSSRPREETRSFWKGFIRSVGVVAIIAGLILKEPDFGTSALVGLVGFWTLVVYGLHLGYAALMTVPAAALGVLIALNVPYMYDRIRIWLDPWRDPLGDGYHITQSLIALGSGGVLGRGLGWSQQKLWYLPEANTDFIFSIIGEEFGLLGTLGVIVLFALFLREGIRVARRAPDLFGSALAFGITMMICIQAAFNIAVTTSAVPTKGISLPFISYGGSSMLFTLAAVGLLVNVARRTGAATEGVAEPAVAPLPQDVSAMSATQ